MAAKVLISEKGQPIKERVSKIIRCSGCEYLHENGNCLKIGGFYNSIQDKDCPKVNKVIADKQRIKIMDERWL